MASIHGFEVGCNGTRKRPSAKAVVVKNEAVPEAPCSVNLFFDVPGYGKAQATGRGLTPDEAVANLQGTMARTRAALAPVPVEPPMQAPPTRISTMTAPPTRLSTLLACGLEKAWNKGDDALGERLIKAAALVRNGAVYPGNREGLLTVRSAQNTTLWYDVEGNACTCKDWEKHAHAGEKYCCKHGLAAMMYTRLAGAQ